MKKRLLTIVIALVLVSQVGMAQYEGGHGFSFRYLGIDSYSPYGDVQDDGSLGFDFDRERAFEEMQQGVEMTYHYGIRDYLAISVPFKTGLFRQRDVRLDSLQQFSVAADNVMLYSLGTRLKLSAKFKKDQILVPYLSAGIDATKIGDNDMAMQFPIEAGLNLRVANNFYLSASTEYRVSSDEIQDKNNRSLTNNMMHAIGFHWHWGTKEDETPPPPPPPPVVEEPSDKDGDGVVDEEDTCPDVAGLAKFAGCPDTDGDDIQDSADDCPEVAGIAAFNGCPDTDGDGLADNKDECPTEAGSISNNGCPVKVEDRDNDGVEDSADDCPDTPGAAAFNGCPDTDGDGVADKNDQCPSTPGKKALNGCPDKDGDGVADKSDKCPTTAGPASNNGCPEIKTEDKETLTFATQAVEFETGKSVIRSSSYPVLDKIADIMAKYPNYSMTISGYTDNVGNDENNRKLSEKRARACYDYLVGKGVAGNRMFSTGYGEESPVADNSTKEGRQRNRRVEFNIFLK